MVIVPTRFLYCSTLIDRILPNWTPSTCIYHVFWELLGRGCLHCLSLTHNVWTSYSPPSWEFTSLLYSITVSKQILPLSLKFHGLYIWLIKSSWYIFFQVTELHEGKCYMFRVRPVNDAGIGKPSDVSEAVLVQAKPGKKYNLALSDLFSPKAEFLKSFILFQPLKVCKGW